MTVLPVFRGSLTRSRPEEVVIRVRDYNIGKKATDLFSQ